MFMCAAPLATQLGFAVGWTDWLMYCSILGYLSIAIAEFIAALGLIPGGATSRRSFNSSWHCGVAMAGRSHQQSISRSDHLTQMRCVFGSCFGVPPSTSRRTRIRAYPTAGDIQRINSRLAGHCHHIRRLAKPLVFHRGRSRSGTQSSARDDRRCAFGDRDLPAC